MLVQVDVTQADISNGIRMECTTCPVAIAINRLLKHVFHSSVRPGYIIIRRKELGNYNDSDVLSTNTKVGSFIHAFDMNAYVEPFSSELDIPDKFLI